MIMRAPTETINLAGSLANRLHSVDSDVPKPMAPDQYVRFLSA